MKYFDLDASYPDYAIAAAWKSQCNEADKTSSFADSLTECESELYARFAARYAELHALPRGARRALQRRLARSSELAVILPEFLQQRGRRLRHRMAWSLAGAALLLALGQGVVTAATIGVTTIDPGIASDGQCSLIEAIVNANNDAATFPDCAKGNGSDTIILPANANVTLSAIDNNDLGATGLPVITSIVTIEGNGATIARQGSAPAFRLMAVGNSGELTLQRVTLSGGSSSGSGGGISNAGGLTVENSTISGNTANDGGGIYNSGALGIGSGFLSINNSTISGNTANDGGGIYNSGALGIGSGFLSINNSTISGNTANNGGGIFNFSSQYLAGWVTITNSTISGNSANRAGGLFNSSACDFYCGGYLNLYNSLIAGNQSPLAPELENFAAVRNVLANNFNLFGTDGNAGVTGFTPGPTDIVPALGFSTAQILGPLKNNGGPTHTHGLLAGSPAIDAGNPRGCRNDSGELLLTDQRGYLRRFDGNDDGKLNCDIGAVEFGAETVSPSLILAAPRFPDAEAGVFFTSPPLVTKGVPPYSVELTAGVFPPGLNYDPIINAISGTPSSFGLKSFRLRITDHAGTSKTATFSVRILRAVGITTKTLPAAFNGRSYRARLVALGGKAPFSWSLLSGNMPQGLSLSGSTGVISGIPTVSGTFDLSFQVTDPMGGIANTTLILNIK
jgi:hypothetical protein